MKVAILSDYSSPGGAKEFTTNVVNTLINKGIRITLFVNKSQDVSDLIETYEKEIDIVQYIDEGIGKTKSLIKNILRDFVTFRKILILRPDILIVSSTAPGRYIGLSIFAKKTFYFLHTVPEQRIGVFPRYLLNSTFFKKLKIITVSNFSKQKISELWGVPSVTVIPNGVKIRHSKFVNIHKGNIVFTLGHVTKYKDPLTWIKVARAIVKKYPKIKFVWGGDGDLYSKCVNLVKNDKNISFVGHLTDIDKDKYFQQAILYYQPSLIESQGIAILEAMSFGLPIVASRVGGIPESVIDKKNGYLVTPQKTEEAIHKIGSIIASKSTREDMGKKSKRIVSSFSNKIWEKKILESLQIHE